MTARYPLPLIALLAVALPFGMAACQKADDSETAQVEANRSDETTFDGEDIPEPQRPSEFDESKIVPDATKSSDGKVTKDINKYTLPIDPYKGKYTNSTEKVQQIYLSKCLKDSGQNIELPEVRFNPNQPQHDYHPLLTVEKAKWGYRGDPAIFEQIDDGAMAYQQAISEIWSIAEDEVVSTEKNADGELETTHEVTTNSEKAKDPRYQALEKCDEKMYTELPFLYGEEMEDDENKPTTPNDLLVQSASYAESHFTGDETPSVKKAEAAWKECMKPLGIPDLPDSPKLMPPTSVAETWYPPTPAEAESSEPKTTEEILKKLPPINPEEVALATKDAECRTSSNYNQIYYDVHWGLLDEFVKANQETLQKTLNSEESAEKKRQDYILQNQ